MAQLHMRAFGFGCAVGCGTCRSTPRRRSPSSTLPGELPAQLRAAQAVPLLALRHARALPKAAAVVVQAKQRKPTPFTPSLSVWQFGACKLCDAEFTPVRNQSKAQRVAGRHYGGEQHYKNERHAELVMRTFDIDSVDDLVDGTFWCACGAYTSHWRTMAIHLRQSKECLEELGRLRAQNGSSSCTDDSEGTDDSGRGSEDEAAHGTTQALEMPEEEFWRC